MSDQSTKLDKIAAHGNRGHAADIKAPRADSHIRCADGSVLSVIAGGGTYCQPRPAMCACSSRGELEPFASPPRFSWEVAHDYPGPYTHVEVMPIEGDWPAEWFEDDSVATVAVENVRAELAKRGGEAQDHPRDHAQPEGETP